MIDTNVCGIAPSLSKLGYKYYVTFIDDQFRFTWVYFLRLKYEVLPTFNKFYKFVETQFSTNNKIRHSDSRGEYLSRDFSSFLSEKGIVHKKFMSLYPLAEWDSRMKI